MSNHYLYEGEETAVFFISLKEKKKFYLFEGHNINVSSLLF